MTYNIHHGEGMDGRLDLERIARVIREQQADVVALQEVDKHVARTGRRDLPAELAALTGMTCIFSNNHEYQGGEYGNAVLSRFPVVCWTNTHYPKVNETEQRGLLLLTLKVGRREVLLMATHLDYRPDDRARWADVGEIETIARQAGNRPVILCGDFNAVPDSRICRRLAESFDDVWAVAGGVAGETFPADAPARRIDYIWTVRGSPLKPRRAWVPASTASDHRPSLAEFEWVR
ncbi:MAG: endonuclease/exonuclease/phosphatase family protein [Verrucomicrobiota bacterium]